MKAIVIDEPWISLILSGQKTWEMRKGNCSYRGQVALIRKGSGQVVGIANVVGSLSPLLTAEAYSAAEPKHHIPPARQEQARNDGWATPWVLEGAKPLAEPVSYRHPSGAVIWVNLEPEVAAAVQSQVVGPDMAFHLRPVQQSPISVMSQPDLQTARHELSGRTASSSSAPSADTRSVVITGGNIRNNHIYLPLEFFPTDAIGGKNKDEAAPRQLSITFQPGQVVHTDIDGTKRILRVRAPVGDFMARSGIVEGDKVVIRRNIPYAYSISKESR